MIIATARIIFAPDPIWFADIPAPNGTHLAFEDLLVALRLPDHADRVVAAVQRQTRTASLC
jgi:hypothetical protein